MTIRTTWKERMASISTDDGQHISRLTHEEVRELVCQIVILGPKRLRQDIREWLGDENVEKVAATLGVKDTVEQPNEGAQQ